MECSYKKYGELKVQNDRKSKEYDEMVCDYYGLNQINRENA